MKVEIGPCVLYLGDCLELIPSLSGIDAYITDPPYGMNKAEWDSEIPRWLHLVGSTPTACFCGVVGMRDYPPADWTGAWVRVASTQRCGKFKGFNNWEPILFYNIKALSNDVISVPNIHGNHGHVSEKPLQLMERLVERMPNGVICDPFMGTGTTGVACINFDRRFIGIENDPSSFDTACKRIRKACRERGGFGLDSDDDAMVANEIMNPTVCPRCQFVFDHSE